MALLETPEDRFALATDLGYPHDPSFVEAGPDGARMAYVDVPPRGDPGDETFLLLHGEPTWGFLWRSVLDVLADHGRVVVPDLIGFGRSHKFDDGEAYTYSMHLAALNRFVEALDLTDATLVCHDWGGVLGLRMAAVDQPDRFARIAATNTFVTDGSQEMPETWYAFRDLIESVGTALDVRRLVEAGTATDVPDEVLDAYAAPFPTPDHKWGAVRFPLIVPVEEDMDGADSQREAKDALKTYDQPFLCAFAELDPITRPAGEVLRKMVPTAGDEPETWIPDAGHFVQEDNGKALAEAVVSFVERNPLE